MIKARGAGRVRGRLHAGSMGDGARRSNTSDAKRICLCFLNSHNNDIDFYLNLGMVRDNKLNILYILHIAFVECRYSVVNSKYELETRL